MVGGTLNYRVGHNDNRYSYPEVIMKTSGEFTATEYKIGVNRIGDPITIVAVGDVHFGAPMFAADRFDEFIKGCKQLVNPYYLLMGDYQDMVSSSERRLLGGGLHESTVDTLDGVYRGLTEEFASRLDFMRGRVIGVLNGNHYGELLDGGNTDMLLAELLGARYLGTTALIRLGIDYHGAKTSVTLCANHGQGASRLVGGSLNRVQQMAEGFDADVYLMGHDHKKGAATSSRLFLGQNMDIRERKLLYLRTGSFLKAYMDGMPNYIADKAGAPSDLGAVRFDILLNRLKGGGLRYELEATV